MGFLVSNWIWILLIGGMLYMHFGPGMKGMHGGHGGGHDHKATPPEPPAASSGRPTTPRPKQTSHHH